MEQLKKSLEADHEMLRARPIIAQRDGTTLCGNQRLLACQTLGWDTIPAIFVDLDERRAREWMLRDNNSYGEWVEDDLALLLEALAGAGSDFATLGFDDRELQQLLARLDRETAILLDPDEIPP